MILNWEEDKSLGMGQGEAEERRNLSEFPEDLEKNLSPSFFDNVTFSH